MIIFTQHALKKLHQRRIARELVLKTMTKPDYGHSSYGDRAVSYKKFGKLHLSVVHRTEGADAVVITAHWVARVKRR